MRVSLVSHSGLRMLQFHVPTQGSCTGMPMQTWSVWSTTLSLPSTCPRSPSSSNISRNTLPRQGKHTVGKFFRFQTWLKTNHHPVILWYAQVETVKCERAAQWLNLIKFPCFPPHWWRLLLWGFRTSFFKRTGARLSWISKTTWRSWGLGLRSMICSPNSRPELNWK